MGKAKFALKMIVNYIQCPECTENNKGASVSKSYPSSEELSKFLKKHRLHVKQAAVNDWGYPRVVGRVLAPKILKGQLVVVRMVDNPHESDNLTAEHTQLIKIVDPRDNKEFCSFKKCKRYKKGFKKYCHDHNKCKYCKGSFENKKEKKKHLKKCPGLKVEKPAKERPVKEKKSKKKEKEKE